MITTTPSVRALETRGAFASVGAVVMLLIAVAMLAATRAVVASAAPATIAQDTGRAVRPVMPRLPGLDFGQESAEPFFDSRDEVHSSIRAGATHVLPGGDIPVAIVLEMGDAWKIWTSGNTEAGFSTFSGEIPTTVEVHSSDPRLTVHAGFISWPPVKPYEADLGDGPQTYASHAGRAVIHVPVTVNADAVPGEAEVVFRVGFQACTAINCLAPATVDLPIKVTIVEPGTAIAVQALHADLTTFPPDLFARIRAGERAPDILRIPFFRWTIVLNVASSFGFMLLLGVAALGGFLLNLTPCVLPVIPLKIMGLSATAGHPARCFALGASMSAGVVAFWLGLGALIASVTAFRSISQLFQYPIFTIGVGVFIIAMALGMLGAFAVSLPRWVTKINPGHNSHSGSFGFGIMTAVLATPCTAPLMGAAAAWAALQPSSTTMQVFAAIGAGMAAPYLVLAAFPRLVNRMPRTGPASDLIKQVMGLLLMAAGAYFAGAGLSGLMVTAPDPPSRLYWWAVALAGTLAGVWLLWRTIRITPSMARRVGFGGMGAVIAAISIMIGVTQTAPGPINWVYYTPERFAQAKDEGMIVVMDFTAEWCLNCKALESAVLYPAAVSSQLRRENGVVPIKVDLTGNNEAGQERLNSVGRVTIPLLIVFAPDGTEILKTDAYTGGQVLEAIEEARSRARALAAAAVDQ